MTIRQRIEDGRRRRRLNRNQAGAPAGYLLDPDDHRTGSHVIGDRTGCAEQIPQDRWDPAGDPLARSAGESMLPDNAA